MISITDFTSYICKPRDPVREILQRIDATTPHLFQVVVDENARLLGTITDGDIRRAMLRGVVLDDAASDCMQKAPTTGRLGDLAGNRETLSRLGSTRSFLPILDKQGVLREILVAGRKPVIGAALVMAGGFGSRLGERTKTTPKPLLLIGDRPILDRVLGGLEGAGVRKMYVSVHYLADQIERFVTDRENAGEVEIVAESEPMGTAGALGKLTDRKLDGPILVVNCDVLTNVDYNALFEFHHQHELDATIAVAQYETRIPFGVVRQTSDGLFAGIDEKPSQRHFVAAGVYCLSPAFLGLVPAARAVDMPEVLNAAREAGLRVGLFPIHEYWTDVGRPDDLDAAEDHLRKSGS